MFCVNDFMAGERERDDVCFSCDGDFDSGRMFRANDWAAEEESDDVCLRCGDDFDVRGMFRTND